MGFLSMKRRNREEEDNEFETSITNLTMANYLMMLSQRHNGIPSSGSSRDNNNDDDVDRVFECKTCNRVFSSFQALGGHRASHKKPKLLSDNNTDSSSSSHGGSLSSSEGSKTVVKPKTHECSICGLVFALGQALGGHMRRHRNAINGNNGQQNSVPPVVMKSKSNNSVSEVVYFDLNLTPSENNDNLEFKLGKTATPLFDFFLC